MKKIIYPALAVVTIFLVYAFAFNRVDFKKDTKEGIQFYKGSLNEALTMAKEKNKLVFVDIYATWCGNCKKLKKTSLSDKLAGDYYNDKFINVSLDGEQGEGEIVVKKYGVEGYPTLLFINGEGRLVKMAIGFQNTAAILELGKSVMP